MTCEQTLHLENAVLLVIDPQEKLLPKVFQSERVTANIILLVRFARQVGLPMLVTTQYEKGIGPIVQPIRKEIGDQPTWDKVEFGCLNNPQFAGRLEGQRASGRNTLILSGIESHICVAQTAIGAIQGGCNVHVASDAISSRTEWNWKIGLERMKQAGAVISSTEMVIFEILKRSDSRHFRAILPDLKEPVQ
jgi:nicotinamidase-related amidase